MTDSRPEQSGEGRPEPDAPAWHSFGVPHGGAPEPPPYTPAMRERPRGELTQPIDTPATQEVRPESQDRGRGEKVHPRSPAVVDDTRHRRLRGVPFQRAANPGAAPGAHR